MNETFEPLIIGFCCNWCSYAGADLAGVSRIQYPTSLRIIRVMCSGMVHPNLVINALTKGADGVLICGVSSRGLSLPGRQSQSREAG